MSAFAISRESTSTEFMLNWVKKTNGQSFCQLMDMVAIRYIEWDSKYSFTEEEVNPSDSF